MVTSAEVRDVYNAVRIDVRTAFLPWHWGLDAVDLLSTGCNLRTSRDEGSLTPLEGVVL